MSTLSNFKPQWMQRYGAIPVARTEQNQYLIYVSENQRHRKNEFISTFVFLLKKPILLEWIPEEQFKFLAQSLQESPNEFYWNRTTESVPNLLKPLLHTILTKAFQLKTSDIHIEALEQEFCIRFRRNGQLETFLWLSKTQGQQLVLQIKMAANLDTIQKSPQDGKFNFWYQKTIVTLRIATIFTFYGEGVVLRLLAELPHLNLQQVQLPQVAYSELTSIATSAEGLILVIGPTGAGKTTTLYALLKQFLRYNKKIITAEDPIEYHLEGAVQCEVKAELGVSFVTLLRAFLRHDPNILMVGEIRDRETLSIALEASFTGHLVLSSFHASNGIEAILRMKNMGIDPFLLTSSLKGLLSQRLIRCLCPACKRQGALHQIDSKEIATWEAQGCPQCQNSGYQNRQAIFEWISITEPLRLTLPQKIATEVFRTLVATQQNYYSFHQSALEILKKGISSFEEVQSYLAAEDRVAPSIDLPLGPSLQSNVLL